MNFLFNINVCRVCMQNEQSSDLLCDKDLLEKFTYTTRLTISEQDNLPKVICTKCTVRLKVAHKFIQTAHESEKNLKTFLAKISNEFKEVTQSNRTTDKSKSSYELKAEQNLTEDEMLSLIGEDETPPAKSISPSRNSNETEKSKGKRIISPIKEPQSKNFQIEIKSEDKDSGDFTLRQQSRLTEDTSAAKSLKSNPTSYGLSEDTLLILSENNVIEFENDIPLLVEDHPQEQEEEEEEQLEGKIIREVNQHELIQEEEEYDEDDTINNIHDTLDGRDQEVEDHQKDVDLKDHDMQKMFLQSHADEIKVRNEQTPESLGNINQEHTDARNRETHELTIINEELSQASSNELNIEENKLHQTLQENDDIAMRNAANEGPDGYLREYETMLNNQVHELQYHSEYIEDNSLEDKPIKDNVMYAQKLEVITQVISDDDDDGAADEVVKYAEPMEETSEDTNKKGQRDKVTASTKTSMRKEKSKKLHRFYCQQCDSDFSTKTNLNRHMLSHEGNKPHVCPECSKGFSQKATLKQHMYTHTGERPYVCTVCNRGFTQCKSLVFHMRRHTGEKPFQCEYCLMFFRQKDALRIHILKYHVIIEQSENGQESFTCIICQKKFSAKTEFKIHMKIHTATSTELITADQSTLDQPRAHSTFQGEHPTTTIRIEENLDLAAMKVFASSASEPRRVKKFQCRKCFKCFALKRSLIRHMSIHYLNNDEDITECSDCDLQFATVDEYHEHLSECHQFACSACPQLIFKTIQDLKLHMFEHDLDQQDECQDETV